MGLTDKTTYILKRFLLLGKGQDVLGFTVNVLTCKSVVAVQQWVNAKWQEEEDDCNNTSDNTKAQRRSENDGGILKIDEKVWDFIIFIFLFFFFL